MTSPQPSPEAEPGTQPMRERILDVALDLFATKGYAETSLREIAQQLGVTKAALYYHFESKRDIIAALHVRMHNLGRELIPAMRGDPSQVDWQRVVNQLIRIGLRHRRLLEVHLKNQALIGELHTGEALAQHPPVEHDLDDELLALLSDPSGPLDVRLRRTASLGAIAGVLLSAASFADVSDEELQTRLSAIVSRLLKD